MIYKCIRIHCNELGQQKRRVGREARFLLLVVALRVVAVGLDVVRRGKLVPPERIHSASDV